MSRSPRNLLSVALAGAAILPLSGCGSSKPTTTAAKAPAAAQPSGAVTATVTAWAKADTPPAICSLMSYGFKLGISNRFHTKPARCTSWVSKALGPFKAATAHITKSIRVGGGQTAVTATFSGSKPQTLYLVAQCGALKVNSINAFHPNPPAPHC